MIVFMATSIRMPYIVKLEQANDNKHKWIAHFKDGRITRFGSAGMDDFTITKDEEQRKRYRARHKKDLDTNDPYRAGFLSFYVLWGDSTSIKENVKEYNRRFG